jgi:hypothetical protein
VLLDEAHIYSGAGLGRCEIDRACYQPDEPEPIPASIDGSFFSGAPAQTRGRHASTSK